MKEDAREATPLQKDEMYNKLYKMMIHHYRESGSIPWQKPFTR